METTTCVTVAHRYAIKMSKTHPELKDQIVDLIVHMYDEIQAGEPADNESIILIATVKRLINDSINE